MPEKTLPIAPPAASATMNSFDATAASESGWLGRGWSWVKEKAAYLSDSVATAGNVALHPVDSAQNYCGNAVKQYLSDQLATGDARQVLAQVVSQIFQYATSSEVADKLQQGANSAYQALTSEDGEAFLAALAQKASAEEATCQAPSEAEVDSAIRATVGAPALKAAMMLSEYIANICDYKALEYAQGHPRGKYIVVDIGVGEGQREAKGSQKLTFIKTADDLIQELEFNSEKAASPFVWTHVSDLPGDRSLWIRRERTKLLRELRHTAKIALLNLRAKLDEIYGDGVGEGGAIGENLEKLFGQMFDALAKHTGKFYRNRQGSDRKEDQFTSNREQVARIGERLATLMFPHGAKDLPLPLHYGCIVNSLLPRLLADVIEEGIARLTEPAMMNKLLLVALSDIPRPKEIMPEFLDSDEAKTTAPVNKELREQAGEFVSTLLKIGSPDFRKFYEQINPKLEAVCDINILKTFRIEESLGEIVVTSVIESLKPYKNADEFLRHLLGRLNEEFLQERLYGDNTEEKISLEEAKEAKEIKRVLGDTLRDFIPYLRSTFFKVLEEHSHEIIADLGSKVPLFPKPRRLTTVFYKVLDASVRKALSCAGSLKGRFFRIIELEQVQQMWEDKVGAVIAETTLPEFYDSRHGEAVLKLAQILLDTMQGPDKKRFIRMPPV